MSFNQYPGRLLNFKALGLTLIGERRLFQSKRNEYYRILRQCF